MVDFTPTRGSEQSGIRPAVIVSNDVNNQRAPTVIVAAITRTISSQRFPQNVHLPAGELPHEGTILGNQIITVAKERLGGFRGELGPELLGHVERALRVVFGLRG